jgi:MYXO-CTERM domain-containing protein
MTGFNLPRLLGTTLLAGLGLGCALPAAYAADALNGKSLYLNGPVGGGAQCSSCHGASPAANVSGILAAANNPAVISAAFARNAGGMGTLYNGKFSSADLADLAAFIGNPNVVAGAVASLAPASLIFSGVTLGQSSAALSTTLSNTGSAALNIGTLSIGGLAAGDFSLSGGSCINGASVAVGASCNVQITFTPTASGARAASLSITHNATGGSSTVALAGTGNAVPQATIGVSASSVNFGALLVGSASTVRTITVSNSGQAALTFSSIALSGANAGIVTLGGTCAVATPVAAGAGCTVTVQATPVASGAFSASLNLASNAANGAVAIGLAGSGAAAARAASATPATLAFGARTIGSGAVTQNLTLANNGNVALAITSTSVSGAAAVTLGTGGTCGSALAVGASCTIPVVFTPTVEGAVAATVLVHSNAADVSVPVSATATSAPVAKPELSDSGPFAFADTTVGQTSANRSTVLSNTGSAALKISTLILSGANLNDFVLSGTCAVNTTLSPASNCTIVTAFKPSVAGARAGSLLIVTDGGTQFSINLSGNGVAVAASGTLTLTPQSFDFGAATIGGTTPTRHFTLGNGGNAALTLSSVDFSGPYASVAEAGACAAMPLVLQPGTSCDLVVRYTPTAAGTSAGSITIHGESAASSGTISLTGQASVAGASTAVPQNYGGGGCSMARDGDDPMLAALVLLALGVLTWRRARRNDGSKA